MHRFELEVSHYNSRVSQITINKTGRRRSNVNINIDVRAIFRFVPLSEAKMMMRLEMWELFG